MVDFLHFPIYVFIILWLRVHRCLGSGFLLENFRFVCVVRGFNYVIELFAFELLVEAVFFIVYGRILFIEICSKGSRILSALEKLFSFECIESSKQNEFKLLFAPISCEKFEKSLERVKTHGNMISLKVNQECLKSL